MKYRTFSLLLMILMLVSAWHGCLVLRDYYTQKWRAEDYNRPIQIEGRVASLPHQKRYALQFLLETPRGLIQLNWYRPYPEIKPGQCWSLTVKMKPKEFMGNPGEFDYGGYLRHQGVIASGYIVNKEKNRLLSYAPWRTPVESFRNRVYQKILQETDDLSMQGILIALILGDKTLLNSVQMEVFERTGTSYFMVISGLHIILFAAMGGIAMRYFWSLSQRATLLIPAKQVGLMVSLFLGVVYSLLAGFVVPTQRALWMMGLMGMAKLFLKPFHTIQMLFFALFGVLLWDPFSVYSIAFWLSFLAVFFLIYTLDGRKAGPIKWWRRWLHEWLYPQWIMYIALTPILVYCFQEFSVIGFVTNLIAVPFMMLIVIPFALLGGIMMFPLPMLGHFLFVLSNDVMEGLWIILYAFALHPLASLHLAKPTFELMILAQIGILIALAPKGWPMRYLGWIMVLPLFFPKSMIQSAGVETIHFAVHSGSVTLYRTKNHLIVEETVEKMKEGKADIAYGVKPYLQNHGIEMVDLWIVNFKGKDHALKSLENTWLPIKIDHMIVNQPYTILDSKRVMCDQPYQWVFDGIVFDVERRFDAYFKGNFCWAKRARLSS